MTVYDYIGTYNIQIVVFTGHLLWIIETIVKHCAVYSVLCTKVRLYTVNSLSSFEIGHGI